MRLRPSSMMSFGKFFKNFAGPEIQLPLFRFWLFKN
jgi:hypothetical protein